MPKAWRPATFQMSIAFETKTTIHFEFLILLFSVFLFELLPASLSLEVSPVQAAMFLPEILHTGKGEGLCFKGWVISSGKLPLLFLVYILHFQTNIPAAAAAVRKEKLL